jgi:peroxiredoxin
MKGKAMKSYFKAVAAMFVLSSVVWACATCGCQAAKQKKDADGPSCKAKGCEQGCTESCKAKQAAAAEDAGRNFTLENYDGTQVSLADFKGKIVVLEWFNYKCPFCVYHYETESTMHDLARKYADKNVQFLAINSTSWQTTQENKAFAEKNKVSYPILDDRTGEVGRAYGATRTPHMFIINEKGEVVYSGALDNAPFGKPAEGQEKVLNFVDMALAELTNGKPVTIQKTREYGCTVKYADK